MGYPESYNELEHWRDELRRSLSKAEIVQAIESRIARESDPERRHILDRFLLQEHIAQGNSAAAEEVRARDPIERIHRWRDECRQGDREAEIIGAIEDRIRTEAHAASRHVLRLLLAEEHRDRGNYVAAETVYLADAEAGPYSWRPLISLASQKLWEEGRPDQAMPIIDRAVDAAMTAGVFRREALGMKARAAVALRDFAMVENAVKQIMALNFTRGNADIGAERDFFDCLPPGSIDPHVARAYDEYCLARGRRRAAVAEEIDRLILSSTRAEWLNVARVVTAVIKECERRRLSTDEYFVAHRIRILVAHGRLGAQGNLAHWRHSEVRLLDVT